MDTREEHVSPDGLLRLCVVRDSDDITVGFAGFPWHTHGDVLAGGFALQGRAGLSPEEAMRLFVDDVLHNRAIIVLFRVGGVIRDAWVTDDPEKERRILQEGESLVIRRWGDALDDSYQ